MATLFPDDFFDDCLCVGPHIRVAKIECNAEREANDD
jgi:hypothetical protein